MKYIFRAYGRTRDGGGFPASNSICDTLAKAIQIIDHCWSGGHGWVEVFDEAKNVALCHLVYADGKLTKVYKFKN